MTRTMRGERDFQWILLGLVAASAILLAACSSSADDTPALGDRGDIDRCLRATAGEEVQPSAPIPTSVAPETTASASGAPNIVLIMTDDQNWQSVGCMPNVIDRLASQGQNFSNAFVTSPNCCPARAGFFTGDYVADHGVFTNGLPKGGAQAFAPTGSFPELLQGEGYATGLFGKYLTSYRTNVNGAPIGFDRYLAFDDTPNPDSQPDTFKFFNWTGNDDGELVTFGGADDDYSTDVLGQAARDFIAESADAPFFLQYSPFAPHRPAALPARHADLPDSYQRTSFPPNYGVLPEDAAWTNELSDPAWLDSRQPEVESIRGQQIASLQSVDDNVAVLLDELEAQGVLSNTVVIFTSDNGFAWGEHRWLQKLCPYESCLRVPLVVADFRPDSPADLQGIIDDRLVTNLDVAATIADLADVFDAELMPSASPIDLEDQTNEVRSDFLIENYGAGNGAKPVGLPAFQGIRTETHKYVRYPDGGEELFLLDSDPFELTNEIENPDEEANLNELRQTVDDSFPYELRRETWLMLPSDGCLGDGTPITADFPGDLPPVEDILTFEMGLETDNVLSNEVRLGLDLVAPGAGWDEELNISLPARVVQADALKVPATSRSIGSLDAANFDEIQIEAAVEPISTVCVSGSFELSIDYLVAK